MSVNRIPPPVAPPDMRVATSARIQAAREAQRAFFDAALGEHAPAIRRDDPVALSSAPTAAVAPGGSLRPGSILDIKV